MQKRLYFQRRILASSIGSTLRLTTQGMWNCRESHAILGRNWMAGVAVSCRFCSRQIIPPGMYKNNSRVHFSTLQLSGLPRTGCLTRQWTEVIVKAGASFA